MALPKLLGRLNGSARPDRSEPRVIDIRIRRPVDASRACPVSITGPDDRTAEGLFRSPFSSEEIDQALQWMDQRIGDSADTRTFGTRLFQALFQGAVAGIYVASQDGAASPRIRLTVDDPDTARIPWELLVEPASGSTLTLRGGFVRGIASESGARSLAVQPPLRVLVADSSPKDLPRLQAQIEARDIAAALNGLTDLGRLQVEMLEHATLSSLLNALREAAIAPSKSFSVLHWIGHGTVEPSTGANVLLFENDEGGVDPVDGSRLADLLHGFDIRLIFLNACHSAAPSPSGRTYAPTAETTRALAEVLLTSGVPAVVGMRVAVLDETARRFAQEFYKSLADGRAIDDAVLDARRVAVGRTPDRAAEIGVPVLFLRSGTGVLLPAVRPMSWVQRQRARYRRLSPAVKVGMWVASPIAGVVIVAFATNLYQTVQGPPRMTGEYNVVVTEFDAHDASGNPVASSVASDLSHSLADALKQDLTGLGSIVVEVRPPGEAGRLSGSSDEQRALEARRLADRIGADVVIYGWLDDARTALHPQFYVRQGDLTGAQELVGAFQLGSAIRAPTPIDQEKAAAITVRELLVSRTRSISELILGLSYFRLQQYGGAERHLDAAIAADGWPDGDGREVLYLFRGGAAGAMGNLLEADSWYDKALELNPQFARAHLGRAEDAFQHAKGTCERGGVDARGLMAARDAYQGTLAAADQPASANVSSKAHLGIARVDVCISQAELEDRWDEAASEATIVIAAFDAGDESLRELAAEAHGVRAFSALPVAGAPDAQARYRDAENDYRNAIALGSRPDRRAAFYVGLAQVLIKLGNLDEARQAYDSAMSLIPVSDQSQYDWLRRLLETTAPSSADQTRPSPLPGVASMPVARWRS